MIRSLVSLCLAASLGACAIQTEIDYLGIDQATYTSQYTPEIGDVEGMRLYFLSSKHILKELGRGDDETMYGFTFYECKFPLGNQKKDMRQHSGSYSIVFEAATEEGFVYSVAFPTLISPVIKQIMDQNLPMCGRYRLGGMPGVQAISNEIEIPYDTSR